MGKIKDFIVGILGPALGVAVHLILYIGTFLIGGLGGTYWLYMAYVLGSWWMVILDLIPPLTIVFAITGFYSLFWGTPDWVIDWFG